MELIRSKSKEDGDCLIWQASMNGKGKVPVLGTPASNGKRETISVRRWIAINVLKKDVQGKHTPAKCRNPRCVEPNHTMVVTRSVHAKMIADHSKYHQSPVFSARVRQGLRKSKVYAYSDETVAEIRRLYAETGNQREVSRRLNVPWSYVHKVVRNICRPDDSTPNPFAGLFSGLVAANDGRKRA